MSVSLITTAALGAMTAGFFMVAWVTLVLLAHFTFTRRSFGEALPKLMPYRPCSDCQCFSSPLDPQHTPWCSLRGEEEVWDEVFAEMGV